ncbi:forkhead box protein N3-like [Asterias rubens]|uniref:forkhead box protein N3-like n=1 Tax=Asterias rubens TaxID=7604 RepID=UPI0014551805|nr:forkhead box protein N3-like [Asterias rubens]XP_033624723.1 forkhead box protein N3-like [Asterias rubens]XP_033624807.1 forkhead box protein N3-like [Asterias rubens]
MPPNRKPEPLLKRNLTLGLSKSFPSATLSRALGRVKMDLNSSCFAEIRMDKGAMDDDELRPLSWLHSTDLLKDMNLDDEEDGHAKENNANQDGMMNKFSNLSAGDRDGPVDPKRHINSKPPFSFSCLIFMAIEDSPLKRLPVKDIYQWIQDHFPYFHNAPTGWKNSVRHNLSLNKCFRKVDKIKGQISLSIGKGSLWCVDPEYRPNLLQALRKTPYHPYHHVLPYNSHPYQYHQGPLCNISSNPNRLPSMHFGYGNGVPLPGHLALVERLLNGPLHYSPAPHNGLDTEREVDAAATMMMFRTPPEQRVEEHARLKSFSPPGPLNGCVPNGGIAPLQAKPRQPTHIRPTLSDLAETALNDQSLPRPRMASTPFNKASLVTKCTPAPSMSDDHTYSLSAILKAQRDSARQTVIDDDDPLECDMSDEDFEDYVDSESDMEQDEESRRLGDSGYIHDVRFDRMDDDVKEADSKHLQLPIKKRPPRSAMDTDLAEGADALLNLAGIKTSKIPLRSISPQSDANTT